MNYYFDLYGWLTDVVIEGRSTTIEPPLPVENKKPNFTGIEWILLEYTPPVVASAFENQVTAKNILSNTDWTALPSVSDPLQSNPYLVNQAEWITFRSRIRNIAINPVEGNLDWTQPQEQWNNE